MFGQLAGFVHGNMFMGLFGDGFQVRLGEAGQEEAFAAGAVPFEPMGRRMKEYVLLPASVVADDAQLAHWVSRAYAYASALPVKEPKPRKAKPK